MEKGKKKISFKKYILWFWGIVLGGFSLILLLFFIASVGGFGALPTFEELENPQTNIATEVISTDGKTIGKYATENRTPIKYKELPENLKVLFRSVAMMVPDREIIIRVKLCAVGYSRFSELAKKFRVLYTSS